jgi:hypothetical protein
MFRNFYILFFACCCAISCTWDRHEPSENPETELPPVPFCDTVTDITFTGKIGEIIKAGCALPGCHIAGTGIPGNFPDYAETAGKVEDGSFALRVLELKDMPPSWSAGPVSLNDCELSKIRAWINAGAPE